MPAETSFGVSFRLTMTYEEYMRGQGHCYISILFARNSSLKPERGFARKSETDLGTVSTTRGSGWSN